MDRRSYMRWFSMCIAPILVAGAVAAVFFRADSAITVENFDKIKEHMSIEEVEALLGGPARDETTGPVEAEIISKNDSEIRVGGIEDPRLIANMFRESVRIDGEEVKQHRVWVSDWLIVRVEVDNQLRVVNGEILKVHRVSEGTLEMIYRWFGL